MLQNGSIGSEIILTDLLLTSEILNDALSRSDSSFCYFLVEYLTRRSNFEIVSPRSRMWKNTFWKMTFANDVTVFGFQWSDFCDQSFLSMKQFFVTSCQNCVLKVCVDINCKSVRSFDCDRKLAFLKRFDFRHLHNPGPKWSSLGIESSS